MASRWERSLTPLPSMLSWMGMATRPADQMPHEHTAWGHAEGPGVLDITQISLPGTRPVFGDAIFLLESPSPGFLTSSSVLM